jgi:hypothetical protein
MHDLKSFVCIHFRICDKQWNLANEQAETKRVVFFFLCRLDELDEPDLSPLASALTRLSVSAAKKVGEAKASQALIGRR